MLGAPGWVRQTRSHSACRLRQRQHEWEYGTMDDLQLCPLTDALPPSLRPILLPLTKGHRHQHDSVNHFWSGDSRYILKHRLTA